MNTHTTSLHQPAGRMAYSIREVALITGLGRDAIYDAIRKKRLEALKSGRRTLVRAGALDAFLASLPALTLNDR